MRIPFFCGLIGSIPIGSIPIRVRKGLDAKDDMNEANDCNDRTKELVQSSQKAVENCRDATSKSVEHLGESKLKI